MVRALHYRLKSVILSVVDFFYPIFRRVMPLQTFRYAACGGFNLLLNLILYPVIHNYVFHQHIVYLGGTIALSPHIATLFLVFLITFPIGFYLSMFVVFSGSILKKRVQLFRYFIVVMICFLLNYILMKLFVGLFHWWATPSYYLNVVIVTTFSYLSQRHFSFKGTSTSIGNEDIY